MAYRSSEERAECSKYPQMAKLLLNVAVEKLGAEIVDDVFHCPSVRDEGCVRASESSRQSVGKHFDLEVDVATNFCSFI